MLVAMAIVEGALVKIALMVCAELMLDLMSFD